MTRKAHLEKRREAMRIHRDKNKRAGRIDLRLGWGTEAERAALQVLLTAMRDPQVATSVEKLIANVSKASRTASSDGFAAKKNSETPPALRVPKDGKRNQASDTPLGGNAASAAVQTTNRPNEVLSEEWFTEFLRSDLFHDPVCLG